MERDVIRRDVGFPPIRVGQNRAVRVENLTEFSDPIFVEINVQIRLVNLDFLHGLVETVLLKRFFTGRVPSDPLLCKVQRVIHRQVIDLVLVEPHLNKF